VKKFPRNRAGKTEERGAGRRECAGEKFRGENGGEARKKNKVQWRVLMRQIEKTWGGVRRLRTTIYPYGVNLGSWVGRKGVGGGNSGRGTNWTGRNSKKKKKERTRKDFFLFFLDEERKGIR